MEETRHGEADIELSVRGCERAWTQAERAAARLSARCCELSRCKHFLSVHARGHSPDAKFGGKCVYEAVSLATHRPIDGFTYPQNRRTVYESDHWPYMLGQSLGCQKPKATVTAAPIEFSSARSPTRPLNRAIIETGLSRYAVGPSIRSTMSRHGDWL